ncbi:MAG: crotonase/enoyl-CoA hydratase family protein [Deltaproteobacteria bacterium]|nr:crotonase/enoyl-CoA hydratase family protein [Deltaproteobacteria bacterium]
MSFKDFSVETKDGVAVLTLNAPAKANALGEEFWQECGAAFSAFSDDPAVRVVVFASTGKHFSSGIDLQYLQSLLPNQEVDPARAMDEIRRKIKSLQGALSAIDQCRVPVLAAIQGGCFGAGVDLVSACDVRYGSEDAFFVIQEINIGMVADVGTLQRMPRQLPDGLMRELAFTGRKLHAAEAKDVGFINYIAEDAEALLAHVLKIAATIAEKSPLAVSGSKEMLNYGRDHSVADGLDYIASWNAGMLSMNDVIKGAMAVLSREKAEFDDLL